MKKMQSFEDVKQAFLEESEGDSFVTNHKVSFEDLDRFKPVVERMIKTDYNQLNGYSIDEMLDAVQGAKTYRKQNFYLGKVNSYANSMKLDESYIRSLDECNEAISEAFGETTTAQSPFPIPSLAFTNYVYERSVAPYFAHIFDLEGNRGFVYYQKITAVNAEGNITAGDLLGSPRQLGTQSLGFVGSHIINEQVAVTVSGTASYTYTLLNKPTPGTLVIRVQGSTGYFQDYASADNTTGVVELVPVKGNPGSATVDYATGALTVTLNPAPTTANLAITADYYRDEQTATTTEIAEATMTVEAEELKAEDFAVRMATNVQQEALSKAIFGRNWNTLVQEAMAGLYNREIGNKILSETAAAIPVNSRTAHDISANIATGGNNALFNTMFMKVVLAKLQTSISTASGLGVNKLTAIAIEYTSFPIISSLEGFHPARRDDEVEMSGPRLIGDYEGTPVVVFYAPILAAGQIVGVYKSRNKRFLTPYVFGEFIKPMVRTMYTQNNLSVNQNQLIASAAGKVVAPNLASQLTVNNISDIV